MNVKLKSKFLIVIFIFLLISPIFSQWTCRSKLGGYLKPIKKKSHLLWAAETTFGYGFMTDRSIKNAMIFIGADYSKKNYQFYFEGGTKAWSNSLNGPYQYSSSKGSRRIFQKQRFGIREGFYRFNNKKDKNLTLGFHSMNFGDYFLLNERGLGLSYIQKMKDFQLNVTGASVLKDFSRFGTFCSVHYLYNMFHGRNLAYIGEEVGETNFAGAMFKWVPSGKKKSSSNDESNEFSSTEKKKQILKELGIVVYNEFGTGIDNLRTHYGLMSTIELPLKIKVRSEILNQNAIDNKAVIYHVKASKQFNFASKGQLFIQLGYFNKIDIDNNAMVYTSFSNLFIGEVMRMDMMDIPLYQFAAKHRIPKWKLHVKLQATQQFTDENISEYNLAIGKTFFKRAKLTTMFSRMEADVLDETYYMARAELRITF